MYASANILIFGHDEMLVETRRLVLIGAGFQVWTATEATAAIRILVARPVDISVLCRTLSITEREAVLRTAHTLRPKMKNLILAVDAYDESSDERDTFFTSFLDPRGLIALIQHELKANEITLIKN